MNTQEYNLINTQIGTTNRKGEFDAERDDNGAIKYSFNVTYKLYNPPKGYKFPKAFNSTDFHDAAEELGKTLKLRDTVYQLVTDSTLSFEATEDMPACVQARYRPMSARIKGTLKSSVA